MEGPGNLEPADVGRALGCRRQGQPPPGSLRSGVLAPGPWHPRSLSIKGYTGEGRGKGQPGEWTSEGLSGVESWRSMGLSGGVPEPGCRPLQPGDRTTGALSGEAVGLLLSHECACQLSLCVFHHGDYTRSSLILLPASDGSRVPVTLQLPRNRAWGQQRVTGHWGPPRPFANGWALRPVSLAQES